jgi:hypothetical protein
MRDHSTRSAFTNLASGELCSTQRTIAIKTFPAVKIKSVAVIEAGENMAFDWSVIERGPSASHHLWSQHTGAASSIVSKV